jgi:regulator of cell morphogenesis and NO signaling
MSTTTVHQYFTDDHRRLDDLIRTFQAEKRKDFARAKQAFREFLRGLQRHIVWEEEILFPSFEERSGMGSGGPTDVMRAEHRLITAALDELHEHVRRVDPECDAETERLVDLLSVHNRKEENGPLSDGRRRRGRRGEDTALPGHGGDP